MAEQIRQLQRERDDATNRLAGLLAENEQLKLGPNETELLKLRSRSHALRDNANAKINNGDTNGPMESEIKFWLARVGKLKAKLQQSPDKQIPEFQFITEQSWMFSSQVVNNPGTATDTALDSAISWHKDEQKEISPIRYMRQFKIMAAEIMIFPF